MKEKIKVFLIEDEEFDVERVRKTISLLPDEIEITDVVSDGAAAVAKVEKEPRANDVIIMDFQIAGGLMGEELIRKIKSIRSSIQIIVITKMTMNINDFDFANALLNAGAFWFCTKYPADVTEYIYQPTDFILSIKNAASAAKLEEEKRKSDSTLEKNIIEKLDEKQIIGISAPMVYLKEQIEQYAPSDANVLIIGESGTGKEIVANNIHLKSGRRFNSFVAINCGSLPSELVESELFGYEKGAFTGANKDKKGLLETADNGTVFLDEIGEMPLSSQSKLLRFLEQGELEKIGRTGKKIVDVRVIAATNKDLKQEVKKKNFREDLYYRLSVVPVYIPPLRDRREDIETLSDYFFSFFSRKMNRFVPNISRGAKNILLNSEWPGNIRELKSVVQRLMLLNKKDLNDMDVRFSLGMYPSLGEGKGELEDLFDQDNIQELKIIKDIVYRKYIRFVLLHSKNDSDAAKKLGVAPSNFFRLCQQLGIK